MDQFELQRQLFTAVLGRGKMAGIERKYWNIATDEMVNDAVLQRGEFKGNRHERRRRRALSKRAK